MGNNVFRDWIPPGENPGAQGQVFRDFVPSPKPQKKEEVKVETAPTTFECEVCHKTFNSKIAMLGHKRSHK